MSAVQPAAAAVMNPLIGLPRVAVDMVAQDAGSEPKRYLYIVSRGGRALAGDIFEAMRHDMANASVELIYDRRVGERRSQPGSVSQERRASGRRHVDESKEISAIGWARIGVD